MGKNKCERSRGLVRKIKEGGVNVFCGRLVPRTRTPTPPLPTFFVLRPCVSRPLDIFARLSEVAIIGVDATTCRLSIDVFFGSRLQ